MRHKESIGVRQMVVINEIKHIKGSFHHLRNVTKTKLNSSELIWKDSDYHQIKSPTIEQWNWWKGHQNRIGYWMAHRKWHSLVTPRGDRGKCSESSSARELCFTLWCGKDPPKRRKCHFLLLWGYALKGQTEVYLAHHWNLGNAIFNLQPTS